MHLHPKSCSSASIIAFLFKDQGRKIEFMHRVRIKFNLIHYYFY